MAARGYEFYLRVLKVSLTSERSEKSWYFISIYIINNYSYVIIKLFVIGDTSLVFV